MMIPSRRVDLFCDEAFKKNPTTFILPMSMVWCTDRVKVIQNEDILVIGMEISKKVDTR